MNSIVHLLMVPLLILLSGVCNSTIVADAEYIGSTECPGCHQTQFNAWQGSHHDMAMRHAAKDSVKGDFSNQKLVESNKTNRFFKKGDEYWVNIAGADGKFTDYQIKYTFGFEPLQQYMVEFSDGRIQLIPFAWDTRPASEGGQRWFNLYPEQSKKHQEFFWTNTGQNWNYMCADCHSTNVEKNFDVEKNTYNTTFSEVNVGCEACHGPASEHISWANNSAKNNTKNWPHTGFTRDLSKAVSNWVSSPERTTLAPENLNHTDQTLVCAQCHSRHVQISNNDHVSSKAFGERYLLNLMEPRLYYPDGQIFDEVFVYGSFLQSKMQRSGVVCSNCHNPHSTKLAIPEKQLCLQCHQSDVYASKKHHHHESDSTGAQCVNCHMPETTYMQIDKRRDHGWHIPRPDLAKTLGTPDTCLSCHKEKDSDWSDKQVQQWFPSSDIRQENHFAPVFSAADQGYSQAASALSHISQNIANAPFVRASALERMLRITDANTLIAVARGVKSEDENIRLGATRGAEGLPRVERWRIIAPLLEDKVLAIRSEAASVLVPLWQELTKDQQKILARALKDYIEVQRFNADRGFAHTNIANVYVHQGQYAEAERAYKTSFRIDPYFPNAYINLSELYRMQHKDNESLAILEEAAKMIPDNGNFLYRIGLGYIRSKESSKAIDYLRRATSVEPNNPQFYFVYGLSLESSQAKQAQLAIRTAYNLGGNPEHLYALCEMQIRSHDFQAKKCIDELRAVAPEEAIKNLERLF